jgi:uridine phosphorylase
MSLPPILNNKNPVSPSVFAPAALLREARRQKGLPDVKVPPCCILDPDGDLVRQLRKSGAAKPCEAWPCYHTVLDVFELHGESVGIIGCVVGASFAVLVAEELFASGCELLISLTSAGQISPAGRTPYFVIIDRALRDEGASYHYAEPSEFAEADARLVKAGREALLGLGLPDIVGASWTTDAPFRETAEAIDAARRLGILAVEMEAAALYSFAAARDRRVICLAHVTNAMGQHGDDFEKGERDGTTDALRLIGAILERVRAIARR